jgi:hypothetical protein
LAKHTSSGTVLRFDKDGKFIQPTNGDAVLPEGTELVVHWDQARRVIGGLTAKENGQR